jgi:hypothetical protein
MAKKNPHPRQWKRKEAHGNTSSKSSPDVFQKAAEIRERLRKKNIHFSDSVKLLRKDRAR